jgi:hypothetical protein
MTSKKLSRTASRARPRVDEQATPPSSKRLSMRLVEPPEHPRIAWSVPHESTAYEQRGAVGRVTAEVYSTREYPRGPTRYVWELRCAGRFVVESLVAHSTIEAARDEVEEVARRIAEVIGR